MTTNDTDDNRYKLVFSEYLRGLLPAQMVSLDSSGEVSVLCQGGDGGTLTCADLMSLPVDRTGLIGTLKFRYSAHVQV